MSEKTVTFEELLAKAEQYDPDKDPLLNPGITKVVKLLRSKGLRTTDSGDGVTGHCNCDLPVPYVHILVRPEELVEVSMAVKLLIDDIAGESIWDLEFPNPEPLEENDMLSPTVEATYCPIDGFAVVSLMGLDDVMLFGDPSKN